MERIIDIIKDIVCYTVLTLGMIVSGIFYSDHVVIIVITFTGLIFLYNEFTYFFLRRNYFKKNPFRNLIQLGFSGVDQELSGKLDNCEITIRFRLPRQVFYYSFFISIEHNGKTLVDHFLISKYILNFERLFKRISLLVKTIHKKE
ncbi:MAG: hypothetical protein AAF363_03300 [Bacteroidota bacterium]